MAAARALFSTIARLEFWGVPEQRELIRNAAGVRNNHASSKGCGTICSSYRTAVGSDMVGTGSRLLQG